MFKMILAMLLNKNGVKACNNRQDDWNVVMKVFQQACPSSR